jgi:hypothetical protein
MVIGSQRRSYVPGVMIMSSVFKRLKGLSCCLIETISMYQLKSHLLLHRVSQEKQMCNS